ncbi:MAG: tetratricopeptide repeat protein [Chlamydiota bacterium]|nr:tetratricopeptide repeat protein [Chlamydiota bacterium]
MNKNADSRRLTATPKEFLNTFLPPSLLISFCTFASITATPLQVVAMSPCEEEIQHAKRITELWKEQETDLVISQIESLIKNYPNSVFKESLLVILGNSHWVNKNYQEALVVYNQIQSPEFQERILKNKLDALINTGNYSQAINELTRHVPPEGIAPSTEKEEIYTYYYAEALMQTAKNHPTAKKRVEMFEAAENRFISLFNGTYDINAREGTAALAAYRGDAAKASEIYYELAKKYPDQKQVLLYKGAKMLAKVDPEEALLTLSEAQKLKGPHQSELTLHKAQLMYNLGYYSHVIEEFIDMREALSAKHLPLLTYYVGKSLYQQKQYQKSLATLEPLARNNFLYLSEDQTRQDVYTHIIACSYQLDDITRGDYWLIQYEERYPNDNQFAKALYHKAHSLVKHDQSEEALTVLEKIVWKYPNFSLIDRVKHQRNMIQLSLEQWEVARSNFISYTKTYPESQFTPIVTKKIPYCTQKMIQKAKNHGEETKDLYRLLLDDLKLISDDSKVVTKKSKPLLVLAECEALCELGMHRKALPKLTLFTKAFSKHPEVYRAHLMLAQCFLEGLKDNSKFIFHAEVAIGLNNKAANNGALHLKLFNAYIRELQKNPSIEIEQKLAKLTRATDHLKQAFQIYPEGISIENRLWLANQLINNLEREQIDYEFVSLTKKEEIEAVSIAIAAFETLYEFNYLPELKPKYVNKYKPTINDYFLMGKLYGWIGQSDKTIRALNHYKLNMSNRKNDAKYAETLYILGQVYEQNNNHEKALSNYQELLSVKKISPKLEFAAKLHQAKIQLQDIPISQRTADNKAAAGLLNDLKRLQVHKNIKTEPIHLEAAIERSLFESRFSTDEKQQITLLKLLKETKKDFIGMDNISAKDYHTSRKKIPKKAKIYQTYMMFLDGYISHLESKLATSRKEVKWKKEAAKSIFENIIKSDDGNTSYITKHVNEALQSLNNE